MRNTLIRMLLALSLFASAAPARTAVSKEYRRFDFGGKGVLVMPLLYGTVDVADSMTLKGCFGADSMRSFDVVRGMWTTCEMPESPARLFDGGGRVLKLRGDSLHPDDTTVVTSQLADLEPSYHVFVPTRKFATEVYSTARFAVVVTHLDMRGVFDETLASAMSDGPNFSSVMNPLSFMAGPGHAAIGPIFVPTVSKEATFAMNVQHFVTVEFVVWDLAKDCLVAFGETKVHTGGTDTVTGHMLRELVCEARDGMWASLPLAE